MAEVLTPMERIEGFLDRKPHMIDIITKDMEGRDRETIGLMADVLEELEGMTVTQIKALESLLADKELWGEVKRAHGF